MEKCSREGNRNINEDHRLENRQKPRTQIPDRKKLLTQRLSGT